MDTKWFSSVGVLAITGLLLLSSACATKSTIETRRAERRLAYEALSTGDRTLVDQGRIRVGMSSDAVYIAWGKPAQILQTGDASGVTTTWLYYATTSDQFLYWRYHPVPHPNGGVFLSRTLDRDIQVREYVAAELIFSNGVLQSWRTLPKPPENTWFGSPYP